MSEKFPNLGLINYHLTLLLHTGGGALASVWIVFVGWKSSFMVVCVRVRADIVQWMDKRHRRLHKEALTISEVILWHPKPQLSGEWGASKGGFGGGSY